MNDVEQAKAEVARLAQQECQWYARRKELDAEISKAQEAAARELIDGDGNAKVLAGQIGALKEEQSLADQAGAVARSRRIQAITNAWQTEASELRRQAVEKRSEADRHQVKTDELLAQLKAHEGVSYSPPVAGSQSTHQAFSTGLTVGTPLTHRLRQEADALDRQAAELELRRPKPGDVAGEGVDSLIEAVLADPFKVGPSIPSVLEWAEGARAQLVAKGRLLQGDTAAPLAYRLYFDYQGKIDLQASGASRVKKERAVEPTKIYVPVGGR